MDTTSNTGVAGDTDGVELVVAPIRYPRAPLIALLIIAVVPAIALLALQRWADTEADRYEETRDEVALVSGDPVDDQPAVAALETGLLDLRRAPTLVSGVASANELGAEVAPIFGFVGDRSCAALSVDGRTVAVKNPEVPVIPASNQKLLVAAVALAVLGPEHRSTTAVAAPAPVDGEVTGDVYLIGGGDPLLTSDDYPIEGDPLPAFNTTSFDRLADAVVAAGITRIRGTVIGDGTRYDDEWAVEDWGDGIAGIEAGPYDALFVNDARVGGRDGRESDPNSAAAREFVRLLGNRGIRVDNGWGSGVASGLAPVIGTVESAPLSDVVAQMLTNSDNDTAELLLKELGVADRGEGTRAAGLDVVDRTLRSWGVPLDGVALRDGSGLSTANRLTCPAILAVLQRTRGGPLEAGLPVAGSTGTLAEEFVDSPMGGRLRAKTGTLDNPPFDADPPAVKALSGFVDTDGPGTIEFALVLNTPDVSIEEAYRPLWNAFGDRLATYPSGPATSELGPR